MDRLTRGAATVLIVASVAACSGSLQPLASQTATPSATTASTATPTAVPSPTLTVAPTPTPTPAPSQSASAPASASAQASPTSTSPAAACTGTPDHQAFLALTANKLPFDVYCAVLPTGWYLQSAAYQQPNGGQFTATYKGPGGATLALSEGAFCTTSEAACSPHVSIRGTATFGPLPGVIDVLSTPPDVFVIYVSPGTKTAYQISCQNLTQARFIALAAALVKVPRS